MSSRSNIYVQIGSLCLLANISVSLSSEKSFRIKQTNKKANLRSTHPSRVRSLDLWFVRVSGMITPDNFAKANEPEDWCLLLRKVKSSKQTNKKANLRSTHPSRVRSLDLWFVRVSGMITPDNFAWRSFNEPEDWCLLLRKVKSSRVVKSDESTPTASLYKLLPLYTHTHTWSDSSWHNWLLCQ